MSDRLLTEFFAKCQACEAVNRIVATYLTKGEKVHCSQCATFIGRWGELAPITAGATHSPPRQHHP